MVNTLNDAYVYYSLDNTDQVSGNPQDLSGGDYHGTNNGCTVGQVGKTREGYTLTTNDYIALPSLGAGFNTALDGGTSYSIWIKGSTATVQYLTGMIGTGTTDVIQLAINTGASGALDEGKLYFGIRDNGGSYLQGYTTSDIADMNDDEWHHVVVTTNTASDTINFYWDGVSQPTTYQNQDTPNSFNIGYPLVFGARNVRGTIGAFFEGSMDEPAIWSKELSQAEVSTLYNSGEGFNPYKNLNDAELYLSLDGATPVDSSGNSHTVTNNGATTGVAGVLNDGFSFTSNDYVSLPNTLTPNGDDWSFSCWFKTSDTSATTRTILGYRSSDNADWIRLRLHTDHTLWLQADDGTTAGSIQTVGTYNDGNWHHVVITRDNNTNTFSLIVDGGTPQTDTTVTGIVGDGTGEMNLGRWFSGLTEYWEGSIDELSIFGRILSDYEITALYNRGAAYNPYLGLANASTYFSLDDADNTGSNPDDLSGNGNDGTNSGATTGVTGKVNQGFSFDGSNDEFTSTPDFFDMSDSSISMWVNPTSTPGTVYEAFFGVRKGTSDYCSINLRSDNTVDVYMKTAGSTGTDWNFPVSYFNSGWNHVVMVSNSVAGNTIWYINGVKVTEITMNITYPDMTGCVNNPTNGSGGTGFTFGAQMNSGGMSYEFDGIIDEPCVYARALSPLDIEVLYNAGSGFNPYDVTPSGYDNKVNGVVPAKINGIPVSNISKFNKV